MAPRGTGAAPAKSTTRSGAVFHLGREASSMAALKPWATAILGPDPIAWALSATWSTASANLTPRPSPKVALKSMVVTAPTAGDKTRLGGC